jgi:hypothetical protein
LPSARATLAGASDTKSQDGLAKARKEQRDLELLIEESDFAIAAANQQLEQLHAVRAEAYRHERWQEFQKTSAKAVDEATFLHRSIMALRELLVEHNGTLRTLTILAVESGKPTTNFRLRHVLRFLESALNRVLPFEYTKLPEPYRNGAYTEFLSEQIDSVSNRAKPQTEEIKTA